MIKIGIIVASIREERKGLRVGEWVYEQAKEMSDKEVIDLELIDLASYNLPFLGVLANPDQERAIKSWSHKMASFDGYIFVTPEYNHAVPGGFKNALDFLTSEVKNKAVCFVGYGFLGAGRAVENLRMIAGEMSLASIQKNVHLSYINDFDDSTGFKPTPHHLVGLEKMIGQLVDWSAALKYRKDLDWKKH